MPPHPITVASTGQVLIKTVTESVQVRHKTVESRTVLPYLVVGVDRKRGPRPLVAPMAKAILKSEPYVIHDEKGAPTGAEGIRLQFEVAPFVLSRNPWTLSPSGEPSLVPLQDIWNCFKATACDDCPEGHAAVYAWARLDTADQTTKANSATTIDWQLLPSPGALKDNIYFVDTLTKVPGPAFVG
jgi:hypothetical protein